MVKKQQTTNETGGITAGEFQKIERGVKKEIVRAKIVKDGQKQLEERKEFWRLVAASWLLGFVIVTIIILIGGR